jgi:hypothetical protein
MIARIIQKNMDERQHRIERRDRFSGVNGQGLDHLGGAIVVSDRGGLAGFEIDRAVTVDAPTPARSQGRELLLAWRLAAGARGLDASLRRACGE